MSTTALKSACLSVGLVSAWSPIAGADVVTQVHTQNAMLGDVHHARIMLGGMGSGGSGIPGDLMLSNLYLPGSGSSDFYSTSSLQGIGSGYAMIGLAGEGSGPYHAVVSAPGLTLIGGFVFEQVFPGYSEQQVIDQLLLSTPASDQFVSNFLRTNFALLLTQQGERASCASFSTGVPFGFITISASTVPAPTACALFPLGLFMARRRR